MKKLYTLLLAIVASMSLHAQYVVSDKYDLWFEDSGNEVTTRKSVACTDDYQDLWNGCYVRVIGRRIYIYENGSSILYGDEINLLYNGYYRVRRSGTWYLIDTKGNTVDGIYGKQIYYYPWGYVAVQRSSGYWDTFHCSGRKMDFYSDEDPLIYYNGCWGVRHGNKWYVYDQNGRQIDDVYGEQVSLINGRWKCTNNGYVRYIDN